MSSKLSKLNSIETGVGGRGIIASYCFMGAFNYYCITVAPSLTSPNNNECDKMIRMFTRSKCTDPSRDNLTKSLSKGGLGFVTPSLKIMTLQIA